MSGQTPIDLVLSRLDRVRASGPDQWEARCPAHDDRNPSLSISIGRDGQVLLHCQAGQQCALDDILKALQLERRDLRPRTNGNDTARRIVDTYDYTDITGNLLYQVVRYDPKDFRQRRPDGNGGWIWNVKGTPKVLYRLPQVHQAIAEHRRIWFVEGEKDVAALEQAGEVATCNLMGAGKWDPAYTDTLAGATVTVVADRDTVGYQHARNVALRLMDRCDVTIVESPYGKDIAEHLGQGRPLDDLRPIELEPGRDTPWGQGTDIHVDDDTSEPEPAEQLAASRRFVTGGSFILDEPEGCEAIWGKDDTVLWPSGEPAMVCGPPGVGKTTVVGQLVMSRIGVTGPEVLGMPVQPTDGKILYLASDRPRQISRSMRRLITDDDRDLLDERLIVWKGPPPADLARQPGILLELCQAAEATTVVLDSLKDMTTGSISQDEMGSGLNTAMQICIADDIEVLVLHHQRKGQDGTKPKSLADVFGSTFLTGGMGSVLLIWGSAGDPIVELIHLKQPISEFGPVKLEHNQHAGTTSIWRGFDMLRWLRLQPTGGTAPQAAKAKFEKEKPNDNERKKAQRELDRLVREGLAVRREGQRVGGAEGTEAATYVATTTVEPDPSPAATPDQYEGPEF